MGHTVPFDTHAFVKKLKGVGVSEEQAEVHAQAIAELLDEQLATKRDLKELEMRLILKLGGMLTICIGIVAALVKLL
jgi:hypothetical protein